jgi:diadenosine tetraphosphate (Ap4A) HIT family hydrolase
MSEDGCLACDLASGKQPPVGGTIYRTERWTVEHCVGPLGVGTLIVKPLRHVVRFAELTRVEAAEFGPLLHNVTSAIGEELGPDQTYITEWSHAGFVAGHIHFVVQPAWDANRERFERPGPFTQVAMFEANEPLDEAEVVAFCDRMRARMGQGTNSRG